MRSGGALRLSLVGGRFPSLSSVGSWSSLTMAEDAAGATILFSAARDNLRKILTVENGRSRPVEPVEEPSTISELDTFSSTV